MFRSLQELNAAPVIPDGFSEWKDTMDFWGHKMISAVEVDSFYQHLVHAHVLVQNFLFVYFPFFHFLQAVAEMAAIGFGLQKDAFTSLMKQVIFVAAHTFLSSKT